jgi:hypothetical protein
MNEERDASEEGLRIEESDGVYHVFENDEEEPLASDRSREEALKTANALRSRREGDREAGQRTSTD